MAYIVFCRLPYIVMAHILMADIVLYRLPYIVMAYIVMADIVMAYIVMAGARKNCRISDANALKQSLTSRSM